MIPDIVVFVPHNVGCEHRGDEQYRDCNCRKYLRWSRDGKQFRRTAKTRSWKDAVKARRALEKQFEEGANGVPAVEETGRKTIETAVDLFLLDKKTQGVSANVLYKYRHELGRMRRFCEASNVFVVGGIDRELITKFLATWESIYPSSVTRSKVRERFRSFLRYCYEGKWLDRVPPVPKIQVDDPETQPLTEPEYKRLLDCIYGHMEAGAAQQAKIHAFIQCMRWTGLAMLDTLRLKRDQLQFDDAKKLYRVVTQRQKMKHLGTGHVSVPIPDDVAQELLAVANGNPDYLFWSGNGFPESYAKNWAKRYIKVLFEAAELDNGNFLKSHRLRDTFAVHLLEHGVPMEEVSRLLGNSLKICERHYAKWSRGRQDRLDALVTGTWK